MEIIVLQSVGIISFLFGTIVIGKFIRKNKSVTFDENLSRVSHTLFWLCLVLPEFFGMIYPGLTQFDMLLGITSFSGYWYISGAGWLLIMVGIYFIVASNLTMKKTGLGYASYKLTKNVIKTNVYQFSRNPMSLGFYSLYIGISLVTGSTYLLLGSFILIGVHIFNLWYFEKHELEIRYGASYRDYSENVPFLFSVLHKSTSA